MDSKFMDSSTHHEAKVDKLTKLNPTIEDAIDDNDVPSSSSPDMDVIMTPASTSPETENKPAVEPPTTDLTQVAGPSAASQATAPGSPVDVKIEVALSTAPKAALVVPTSGRRSHCSGYATHSRRDRQTGLTSGGEHVLPPNSATPTRTAGPPPAPGQPRYVHPPASFPMRLPFLANVGLPGDVVINSLDTLVDYMGQLVRMLGEHRTTVKSFTTENEALHASLIQYIDALEGSRRYDAVRPGTARNHVNIGAADELFAHFLPHADRPHSQSASPHPQRPRAQAGGMLDEAQAFNALLTGIGMPGLSLNVGGYLSNWSGDFSGTSQVDTRRRPARSAPIELAMLTPTYTRPSVRLTPVAPLYRGHSSFGDWSEFIFHI